MGVDQVGVDAFGAAIQCVLRRAHLDTTTGAPLRPGLLARQVEEYLEFSSGAVSDPTSMGADWGADCLRPWNGCGSLFVDTI